MVVGEQIMRMVHVLLARFVWAGQHVGCGCRVRNSDSSCSLWWTGHGVMVPFVWLEVRCVWHCERAISVCGGQKGATAVVVRHCAWEGSNRDLLLRAVRFWGWAFGFE